jgi:hypothetical protein
MPTPSRKITNLTRYDLIINSGIPEQEQLEIFLQTCIWARKPRLQTAYDYTGYGIADEYAIYSCDLSSEDLTVLKLKFNGIVRIKAQDPQIYRSNDETYKQAFGGEPYFHSEEARKARAEAKYQFYLAQ